MLLSLPRRISKFGGTYRTEDASEAGRLDKSVQGHVSVGVLEALSAFRVGKARGVRIQWYIGSSP